MWYWLSWVIFKKKKLSTWPCWQQEPKKLKACWHWLCCSRYFKKSYRKKSGKWIMYFIFQKWLHYVFVCYCNQTVGKISFKVLWFRVWWLSYHRSWYSILQKHRLRVSDFCRFCSMESGVRQKLATKFVLSSKASYWKWNKTILLSFWVLSRIRTDWMNSIRISWKMQSAHRCGTFFEISSRFCMVKLQLREGFQSTSNFWLKTCKRKP